MFFRLNVCQHDELYSAPTWKQPNLLLRNEQTKQTRYTSSVWHQQQYTGPSVRYTVGYLWTRRILYPERCCTADCSSQLPLPLCLPCFMHCSAVTTFIVSLLPPFLFCSLNGLDLSCRFRSLSIKPWTVWYCLFQKQTLNILGNKMYRMFISIIEFY